MPSDGLIFETMGGLSAAEKISSKRSIFAYQLTPLVLVLNPEKAVLSAEDRVPGARLPGRIEVNCEAIRRLCTIRAKFNVRLANSHSYTLTPHYVIATGDKP